MLQWKLAIVIVLSFHLQAASTATVDGCDGHLCSTESPSRDLYKLFAEEENAVRFARCHASCLERVS